MLGIGNIVTAGSKVANVVRKGLQAWYKADETQAPLGEEKIVNGSFNAGPNLITAGSFDGIADGTNAIDVDGALHGWTSYGSGFGIADDTATIVNEQLVIDNKRSTSTTNEISTGQFNSQSDVDTAYYKIAEDTGTARAAKSYDSGEGAMKITYSQTNGHALYIGDSEITANKWYNVKFRAKGTTNNIFQYIGDTSGLDEVISNPVMTTDWQDYEFNVFYANGPVSYTHLTLPTILLV